MGEIEVNDRVLVSFDGTEHAGVVTGHPEMAFGELHRGVRLDTPLTYGNVGPRAEWLVPVGAVRLEPAALDRTVAAIAAAKLEFASVVTAAVGSAHVAAAHEARGWVLIAKTAAGKGRAVLTFAAAGAESCNAPGTT